MKYRDLPDHPCFPLLLAWRAILVGLAFHAVIEKSFAAMLLALGALGALALFGEFVFSCKVNADNLAWQRQTERASRERRAEEARTRYAAVRALLNEDGKKGFALDEVGRVEASPAREEAPVGMSAKAFDLALVEGELAERRQQIDPGGG